MKAEGTRIAMLTAYDYCMARLVDRAGADVILVGDSLAMVVQGRENTIPATVEQMIYHAEMVVRGTQHAMVVIDIPFPGFHLGRETTVANAARMLKESGAQAVKLEGGANQAEAIRALVGAGIPVMAHLGLRPQAVLQLGGYRVDRDEERLIADAKATEAAGAFAILLECIPSSAAATITAGATVPTIGIGAGPDCDGQVLVLHDILGWNPDKLPKHARQYADLGREVEKACRKYCEDVRDGKFPSQKNSF
jgi:3-methyl-2-oxobutanoate hydroxymethyltransferase